MLNLPNLITLLRLLLIPVVVICLLEDKFQWALVFFLIAGLSDALDGFLARTLKQKTQLGALLDPIADKLLLDTIYLLGVGRGLFPEWLAVIIISRDVLILLGFLLLSLFKHRLEVHPSLPSKLTTACQIITVVLTLYGLPPRALHLLFFVTAGLTIFSGLHYLYLGLRAFAENNHDSRPQ